MTTLTKVFWRLWKQAFFSYLLAGKIMSFFRYLEALENAVTQRHSSGIKTSNQRVVTEQQAFFGVIN